MGPALRKKQSTFYCSKDLRWHNTAWAMMLCNFTNTFPNHAIIAPRFEHKVKVKIPLCVSLCLVSSRLILLTSGKIEEAGPQKTMLIISPKTSIYHLCQSV